MSRVRSELFYQIRFGLPIWFLGLLFNWLPDVGPALRIRGYFFSLVLPGRPKSLLVGRDVTLLSINRLRLGNKVYLAKGCWLNAIGGITIEDEVFLAPYVVMSSSNHGFAEGSVQRGGAHPAPITIGFGTWLAAHAVVTAGTTVGKGNLVAGNSLVNRNTGDNLIVMGVPAAGTKERVDNPSSVLSKHDIK
jgi:acetyltransferase-like isoleucine patch superfamily enzyme